MSEFDEDGSDFLEELNRAAERQKVRISVEETVDTRAKQASPGNLTGEAVWTTWEAKLKNHLSVILGVNGVPLSYVIREKVKPDTDAEFESFTEQSIASCPLKGADFAADARTVHQIITSFTTGENAEQWIKPFSKYEDSRRDMKALRAHFRGEGNQTRRVRDAETLRDTLHYKSEAAMPFATFLSKCQKMFNLFEDVGEPYTEGAKLRFLLEKIQSQELSPAVEAVRSDVSLKADSYNFAKASNHLASQIKPKPARGLSSTTTSDSDKAEITRNGKIHLGFYKNWNQLSQENRDFVLAERKRLGIKPGNSKKKGSRSLEAQVKALRRANKKKDRKIKAMKRNKDSSSEGSRSGSSSDSDGDNAGNAFGGRSEKEKKKSKRKKKKH